MDNLPAMASEQNAEFRDRLFHRLEWLAGQELDPSFQFECGMKFHAQQLLRDFFPGESALQAEE